MNLTETQNLVVNTNNKSLLVSASAGSGKTFVVIERIIQSIKNGKDISRLLVLTFTNAAATELKSRLIDRLYSLKEEYLAAGDTKNVIRINKQISKVPMADVSTIHSFCLNIIRNNFYSLGIDPNVTTLDATKATILLNQSINEIIEQEFENANSEFLDILDVLGSESKLIESVYNLYISYNSVLDKDKWIEDVINTYKTSIDKDLSYTYFGQVILQDVKERFNILKLELEQLISKLDEEFQSRKDMLEIILYKINTVVKFEKYDELYNYLDELENLPRLPSTKVTDEDLKEQVKHVKKSVTDEVEKIRTIMYKDSKGIILELNESSKYIKWYLDILSRVCEKYTEYKKEKNAIDFADYEHLAILALQDENVVQKYKEKYQEIYIDEYQDTSYSQESIINKIAKDNNVIMVGDVKQSIYGFRNAKPDLFTEKYELFQDVKLNDFEQLKAKIVLAQNFRSRKEIINSTNDVFKLLMSKNFGGIRYEEKEALMYGAAYDESSTCDYITELNIIEKTSSNFTEEDEELENANCVIEDIEDIRLEAMVVSKRIKELVSSGFEVYDLKTKKYRKCEYNDIVILLRSVEGKANIVSDVLNQNEIPNYADTKVGFYKSDEINLIISFLKILNNPYDDVALASVLYSIIGKFTLDDLAVLRADGPYVPLITTLTQFDKNDDVLIKIKEFLNLLERFKKYINTYTISEVLIKLYNETGLYLALRLEKLGEVKCANLDSFIQIVSEFENSETMTDLYSLIKYLEVLKNKESAGDSPKTIGENENVVRIMTIHKSKGLEFPVVILMNTASKYNEQDTKDKLQFDDELGIGIDIYNSELRLTYPSIIKQAVKAKGKKQLRSEALRVLYVAFTRAKEKLIIYGTIPSLEKYTKNMIISSDKKVSDIVAFNNNSHLKCILQTVMKNDTNFKLILHKKQDYTLKEKNEANLKRNEDKILVLKSLIKDNKIKVDKNELETLRQEFVYIENKNEINKKYSVSELKNSEELLLSELKPQVLEDTISSTSYGTLIHNIIESIKYSDISRSNILEIVKNQISIAQLDNKVNEEHITNAIMNMLDIIKEYIDNAICIKNELEFVIKDNLNEIPEVSFEKETLIQGVIDMYIHTYDGKHIILDFKTDKVDNANELLDRYKLQLEIYKRAIELSYEVKVDGTYIYSFSLNKLIEV